MCIYCNTDCDQNNPCDYDNCGCPNPTTFICTTYTGNNLTYVAQNGDKGDLILSNIDNKLIDLYGKSGKVLLDASDPVADYLAGKLVGGLNVSLQFVGSGAARQLQINSTTGGVPVDVNVKNSANDTTSGYLFNKLGVNKYLSLTVLNPNADEKAVINLIPSTILSTDSGNQLEIGSDGGIKTSFAAPDGSETKVVAGTGVNLSGIGTNDDPYVLSTNASIQAARPCFDGIWRNVTITYTDTANVTKVSGVAQYRYRYDGSIELKGAMTFNVSFGNYASANRKFTITLGNIPVTCITASEQAGTADLKNTNYIDVPQASVDQITQMYGYTIRKSAQNIILEFQSSFTNATTKTIVVNFDSAVSHPSI